MLLINSFSSRLIDKQTDTHIIVCGLAALIIGYQRLSIDQHEGCAVPWLGFTGVSFEACKSLN